MLFGHGDDFYNTQHEVKINFSSNVWHSAELKKLHEHLSQSFDVLSRYPEPDAGVLKRLLSRRHEVNEENLLITNGSISAFYMLAETFSNATSTILIPSFSEYEDACKRYNHTITFVDNSEDLINLSLQGQKLCWICNPNNPDGKLFHRAELITLIEENPETTFIIDQAYASFTTEIILKPSDVKLYPNLILVQSISKAYNVSGLRVGYVIANKTMIEQLSQLIIPWAVNSIAIEACKYILIHPAQFTLPIRKWQRNTADLMYALTKLNGIEVIPTATPFFLVRIKDGKASELKDFLLQEYGILIRDASNFRGLDDSYFRICTQRNDQNEVLVEGVKRWLEPETEE